MGTVRVRALANLALVKYFGKRDVALNLPATGSLSLALEPLATETEIAFDPKFERDTVHLDGKRAGEKFASRVERFLDLVRQLAGSEQRALVETKNSFPTAAGLASSASGFAALALAATRALGLEMTAEQLSALARRGSGSAARSVPGGIAVWQAGEKWDGGDSFATAIAGPGDFDLRVVVGVTEKGPKPIGSTEAMKQTHNSSPYYPSWIASTKVDLEKAIEAVHRRDFTALGEITERSALSMHAAALAARPGIVFWRGPTVEALHLARRLRGQGIEAYFTCDAGPQPKLLCTPRDEEAVADALDALPGIQETIRCRIGGGAREIA